MLGTHVPSLATGGGWWSVDKCNAPLCQPLASICSSFGRFLYKAPLPNHQPVLQRATGRVLRSIAQSAPSHERNFQLNTQAHGTPPCISLMGIYS